MLTVTFILLSYRTGNLLFQFDSIVSFVAALILLFRDTTHTVQVRVVNRILTSSHQLVADLSAYGLGRSSFVYVPEGRRVGDVMLVPVRESKEAAPADAPTRKGEAGFPAASTGLANSQSPREGVSRPGSLNGAPGRPVGLEEHIREFEGVRKDDEFSHPAEGDEKEKKAVATAIGNLKFAPPGRDMAELFLRESALRGPTIDDIVAALPDVLVAGFKLASSASVRVRPTPGDDAVEVTLVQPVLANSCGHPGSGSEPTGIVGCEICSMLAVLFSSSTRRLVSLDGCIQDEERDVSTTSLHLGAKYLAD